MMVVLLIWWIGALFTDGLLDPCNSQGTWKGIKRFFTWPVELGIYVRIRQKGEESQYYNINITQPDAGK